MEDFRNIEKSKSVATPEKTAGRSLSFRLMSAGLVLAVLIILGLGYGVFQLQSSNRESLQDLNDQLAEMQENLPIFAQRIDRQQKLLNSLASDWEVMQERVGVTEKELAQARILAENLRAEQNRTVESLSGQIVSKANSTDLAALKEESLGRFEQVDTLLSGVQAGVDRNLQELQSTWEELAQLGVQVTEQGQFIATNSDGIRALERRGEKDYVQFVALEDEPFRVGDLAIELRDTNRKKSRAKLRLYFDDKRIVRDRIATNQPLILYIGKERVPYEVVINEVEKGRIWGYVSVPLGITSADKVAQLGSGK